MFRSARKGNTAMADVTLASKTECVWRARAVLGEGLVFDQARRRLWFVDIKQPRLMSYELPTGATQTIDLPLSVSSLALPSSKWSAPAIGAPVFLCVCRDGYAWLGVNDGSVDLRLIADPEHEIAGNRFNDGKLGPDDRFYAGTMDDAEARASGSLYALAPDGAVTLLDTEYNVTNGPAFSPDGRTLYHNDSALRRTYAFDLADDGHIGGKRTFHAHDVAGGYPDGMTVDADGNLYIAMWDGARIQRLDRTGKPTGHIPVPVARPTNCVFVDAITLAFTSARIGLSQPGDLDGGLFLARLEAADGRA